MNNSLETTIENIGKNAREASFLLASLEPETKNQFILNLAKSLIQSQDAILIENQKDLDNAAKNRLNVAFVDRLRLSQERIQSIVEGLYQIAKIPDPVGQVIESMKRPNGLEIRKVRTPIGVIGIIYESRPNVTIDCAVLCLKSGNASILRGGSDAFHTNTILVKQLQKALIETNITSFAIQMIPTPDRAALDILLLSDAYIDCIIPRGGESLIRYVVENSSIPVIKHSKGVCNLYIDQYAHIDRALNIAINAKCQRPGVCNAIENLFMHQAIADEALPRIASALVSHGVELRVDAISESILKRHEIPYKVAIEEDFYTEYLDLILSIQIVPSIEKAIDAIHKYGSKHSESIVTEDKAAAALFQKQVDAAAVYWNASTRFTDGFEFGLGAEIGISTDKIHARGPMGLQELCSYKYLIQGDGQIRS